MITNWIDMGLYCRRDNNLYLADYVSTNVFFKGFRHLQKNLALLGHRTFAYYIAWVLPRTSRCVAGLVTFCRRFVDPLDTVIVSILHALRSLTTSLSFSRPRAPLHVCPGPSRFPPASHSCTFSSAVPSSSTPYSIHQHHLLLQNVHPHHVTEEQHLLYVATTGLLALIPVSLHCVFKLLVGLAYMYLSALIPPVVVLFLENEANWKSATISSFFKRPNSIGGTCLYVCTYVRTYVRTYVCMYVCVYVCLYICMDVCMYICIVGRCAYVRMYVRTYVYTSIVCLCVWMYECMHA